MFNPNTKLNHSQKVLTADQFKKLVANNENGDQDHAPVVKFFDPMGAGTWLISELDPETGYAFALCDLGFGEAELGSVDLNELIKVRHRRVLGIERDLDFKGDHPMSWYVEFASTRGSLAGV